jgi:hypothetical protein
MKDVLTLVTYRPRSGVLRCVRNVKPDAMSAVPPLAKPEVCQTHGSWTRGCGSHLLAAASGAVVRSPQSPFSNGYNQKRASST